MAATEREIICHKLNGVAFSMYNSEHIKMLSVKEVTNPQTFDALMHPTHGGLYDPAFGPTDKDDLCDTCGLNNQFCPGHMGYIELPLPVYNPVMFKILFQLLRGTCFSCHCVVMKAGARCLFMAQMRILEYGQISAVEDLRDHYRQYESEDGKGSDEDVQERLMDHVYQVLEGLDLKEAAKLSQVKNVVEYRQGLLKSFLRGDHFAKHACPKCKAPIRPMRNEQNTKIFFSKGLSRKKAITIVQMRKKMADRRQYAGGDDEEDMVFDEEEEEAVDVEKEVATLTEEQQYLTPSEARSHLRDVWKRDGDMLKRVMGVFNLPLDSMEYPTDAFFLEVMPVPPSRFRPVITLKEKRFENPQTANLSRVVTDVWSIKEILATKLKEQTDGAGVNTDSVQTVLESAPAASLMEKLQGFWMRLQTHINCIVDSDLDKLSTDKHPGIKQLIEKKEGLFRKHMMGKRVDCAARSVISPDPYINTNEIGIPDIFAKKLMYPQPVTPWNFPELKQAVINGPMIHPGACFVEHEDGTRVKLMDNNPLQRAAIAKQLLTPVTSARVQPGARKVVYRHLKNGDIMLLNRQPTLHRPSIQAHRARVLPGEKTIRLHYANCKAYNADFDGDEMNAHFPQNELARAEAYNIAATDYQYLVPKDGTPLAGLIQDHMVSGVTLTIRGQHFTLADYQQLVYSALTDKNGEVTLLPPCIRKPCVRWSGKQVLSTVLLNVIPDGKPPLNLLGKAKVSARTFVNQPLNHLSGVSLEGEFLCESEVVIRHGELLVGILDKAHYGNTPYGLVHCCYELYGGKVAGKLLTSLARLFTAFLQFRGFTLGVEDILVKSKADHRRRKVMKASKHVGPQVAASALGVDDPDDAETLLRRLRHAHFNVDDGEIKDLDLSMKGQTDEFQNKIVRACMPVGLQKKFPHNNLQLMVQSGAKGSMVNCIQISALLGQIELEGRRPALMMSGQFLPSFLAYDMAPRTGGYVDGRFLTGIRPQEYFFHCMAGREGLIDTAVKTSRSGYLQRCIIKHMEGLTVGYDMTVRDSDGSVVQFQYGEDGLDILKTQFLKTKQFPFLIRNQEAVHSEGRVAEVRSRLEGPRHGISLDSALEDHRKKFERWKRKNVGQSDSQTRQRSSPFLVFCRKHWASVLEEHAAVTSATEAHTEASKHICQLWRQLGDNKKRKYQKETVTHCPEPLPTRFRPDRHFGSVNERFEQLIEEYLGANPQQMVEEEEAEEEEEETSGRDPHGRITADRLRSLLYLRHLEALVQPGESVGLLAAQSIGEPSTQMTLNTFHFAGRGEMNVTLGIPRLREILMVASASIRTPNMDIPLRQTAHAKKRAKVLQQKLTRVYLSQVLEDVQITETLSVKSHRDKCRLYKIRFQFLPRAIYKKDFYLTPHSILAFMEREFFKHLQDSIGKHFAEMQKSSLLSSAKVRERRERRDEGSTAVDQPGGEEPEEVYDDDMNDGDTVADKTRDQQMEELDYAGEDEERQQVGEEESDTEDVLLEEGLQQAAEAEEMTLGEDEQQDSDQMASQATGHLKKLRWKQSLGKMDPKRINSVLSSSPRATEYVYDAQDELWCQITFKYTLGDQKIDMASLLESEAKRTVVTCTPGISRCFLTESKTPGDEGRIHVKTEGVNIQEMYNYQEILDLNRLYTNDIHAIAVTYGIEAACRAIVKEVRDVFAAYGIEVDYHHLSLVADYMTFEGQYKAFNRVGIESNPSPLQKMTFETTMHFLKSATIQGAHDDLKSPSARLVVGRVVSGGTGSFQLINTDSRTS